MATVIKFKRKNATRDQALNWLSQSCKKFPKLSEKNAVSADLFHGWRFVLGLDGVVYFANCKEPGITESDLISRQKVS